MKMMFFSSERAEVELVRKGFVAAGIACEVRDQAPPAGVASDTSDTELWIQHDGDAYRASMICVEMGVGFAKRAKRKPVLDLGDDNELNPKDEAAEGPKAPPTGPTGTPEPPLENAA